MPNVDFPGKNLANNAWLFRKMKHWKTFQNSSAFANSSVSRALNFRDSLGKVWSMFSSLFGKNIQQLQQHPHTVTYLQTVQ